MSYQRRSWFWYTTQRYYCEVNVEGFHEPVATFQPTVASRHRCNYCGRRLEYLTRQTRIGHKVSYVYWAVIPDLIIEEDPG